MIQLDRRNGSDYKTYRIPVSDEFRRYIEKHTGFTDAGRTSRTDIAALCRRVAGVNLSVGYHNEHTAEEYLDLNEWRNTLDILRNLLRLPQPRFPLPEETPVIYTTEEWLPVIQEQFADYDVWIRDVYGKPDASIRWTFWQFSNRHVLKGYSGAERYIDMNVFCGNEEEFNQYH